ncbi:MAG: NAD(P)/FAD-dependent oxidoreductase [Pseudomonadota bacterium]
MSLQEQVSTNTARHVDVLIVGAGISGVGAAHYLQENCPEKSFLLLENQPSHGGTWRTHTYPGIRSDSDLYTFGYSFRPWMGKPIAKADAILDYMDEVIEAEGIRDLIHYQHEVVNSSWSSEDQVWTVTVHRTDTDETLTYTAGFLWMCQGYYDHKNPYTPEWDGMGDFKGDIVHPQLWPENYDLSDKKVVVIGSGATAATLIPSIAGDCAHVTMLQRSPTFFFTGENRNELADQLRALEIPDEWTHEIVRRHNLAEGQRIQDAAAQFPDLVRQELLDGVKAHLGEDFDVETHFNPSYRPWQQRLAYIPDGDLFEAMKSGQASIVTDHIDRFTEEGILLKSGETLEADVIITATGFNMQFLGGIPFQVDGNEIDFHNCLTHRGIMLSGIPNLAFVFGYFRTSWTMRAELVSRYVCRLLNEMDGRDAVVVTPTLRADEIDMPRKDWIDDDDFNSGYLKRGMRVMPSRGAHEPWDFSTSYYDERVTLPEAAFDEGSALIFEQAKVTEPA